MASIGWGDKSVSCWREVVNREKTKSKQWSKKLASQFNSETDAAAGWQTEWLDRRNSFGHAHYVPISHKKWERDGKGTERRAKGIGKPPGDCFAMGLRTVSKPSEAKFYDKDELKFESTIPTLPPLTQSMPQMKLGFTLHAPKGVPTIRTPRGRWAKGPEGHLYPGENEPTDQIRGRIAHNDVEYVPTNTGEFHEHWKGSNGGSMGGSFKSRSSIAPEVEVAMLSDAEAVMELQKMSRTKNCYKGGGINPRSCIPI